MEIQAWVGHAPPMLKCGKLHFIDMRHSTHLENERESAGKGEIHHKYKLTE
jgi:hypothetical protein